MLQSHLACSLLTILWLSLFPTEAGADEGAFGCAAGGTPPAPSSLAGRRVELFQAAADDRIDVELIAPSAREVYLRVTNKTEELLAIELPKAFAAVPVLGQFAPGGNLGGGNGLGLPGLGAGNNNFGAGANLGNFAGGNQLGAPGQAGMGQGGQGLGGGFNNGGGGIGNVGGGNLGGGNLFGNGGGNQFGNPGGFRPGMFRVPAGRVGKVRAETVCLEHGKPEPNSRMRYRIVPLEDFFSGDPRIARICQLLAQRQISQNVAQAAAWHVANGVSWEELAAQDRVRSNYTGNQKFFTSSELKQAMRVAEILQDNAATAPTSSAPASASLKTSSLLR